MSKYEIIGNVFNAQYENFIGGKWIAPIKGEYSENKTPN